MKTILNCLLATILVFVFATITFGQDEDVTHYHVMDYMKVEPGMHGDYAAVENAWKKIHEAKIKDGKYVTWALSEVISPRGTNVEYNYVTRTTCRGEAQLDELLTQWSMPDNLQEILTWDEIQMMDRVEDIRSLVKSEIWATQEYVPSDDMSGPSISVFNYFNFPETGSRADHLAVERDIWMPVHKARVAAGELKGWVLLTKVSPFGTDEAYHDATVDIYDSLEQRLNNEGNMWDYFQKAHPGKDLDDLLDRTSASSEIVRGEIWRRVHIVSN